MDTYGRQVSFGANLALNAIDVNLINDSSTSRLGPVTNLSAVTAIIAGASVDVSSYHNFTVHVISSAVSIGGTVTVEHSLDGTNWATIATFAITSNTTNELSISQEARKYLRTNLTVRSDGTYTTLIYAGN